MPEYQIMYQTENVYSEEMKHALIEFLILPFEDSSQQLLEFSVDAHPPVEKHFSYNTFGFKALQFRIDSRHRKLKLTLKANVFKEEINPFEFHSLPLDKERSIFNMPHFDIDNYPFLQVTNLTSLPEDYVYMQLGDQESIFDFVKRLNNQIHSDFAYNDEHNNPKRTVAETLEKKIGVCQDFTHLMLAVLRKNKIPSRYVSGYLHQGQHYLGDGAIHAWVQALVPGIGWIGFDPTNNLLEDHHYIKIAHGVDINDCNNVRGVITGPGSNETNYSVLVKEQNRKENQ